MLNFDYLKDIPELGALYRYCDSVGTASDG